MSWNDYNLRRALLRELVAIADRERHLTLTDLLDRVDPERAAFADETALLLDLQLSWFQRLGGHLDRGAGTAETPEIVAIDAWASTAAQMPGARHLLDQHTDHPALQKALATERTFLAASAGMHGRDADGTLRVESIVDRARQQVPVRVEPRERGLVSRLKALVA